MEFSLLGAAAIGVGAFWLMLRWEAPRGNAADCAVDLWDVGLTSAIAGLFIGRLAAMASAGVNPLSDPGQIILIRSGVSTTAVVLGTMGVFAVLARKDLVSAADAIAPAALAGLAGWQAGCVTSDACLGSTSELPWAMALPGSDITRHPVEWYTAILLALGAIALAVWKQRGRPPAGSVAGAGLAIAGGSRLITEPMRVTLDGGPVLLYASGVVIGIGLMIAATVQRIRRRVPPGDPAAP